MIEGEKKVVIVCDGNREKESVEHALQNIDKMTEKQVEEVLKLMPHEVSDLKDAIRRSRI